VGDLDAKPTQRPPAPQEEPPRLGLVLSTVNLSIDTLEELYLKLARVGIKGHPAIVAHEIRDELSAALGALREARTVGFHSEATE